MQILDLAGMLPLRGFYKQVPNWEIECDDYSDLIKGLRRSCLALAG
jgi:hypothetical protein